MIYKLNLICIGFWGGPLNRSQISFNILPKKTWENNHSFNTSKSLKRYE